MDDCSVSEVSVHSQLGASSMYRWSACPGSVRLSKGIKAPTSKYAQEGTDAHEVASYFLENGRWPGVVDDDVKAAVRVYIDAITETIKESKVLFRETKITRLIEHKFDLSEVYPGCYGTADCVLYFPNQKTLYVFDYKHGMGIPVEVTDNPQLRYYGLGALLSIGCPCEQIELVIVQPRCPHPAGPIRRERLSALDLLDFSADLIDYAKATEDPKAPLNPGDWCRFCPAAGICPALKSKAQGLAKLTFSPAQKYEPAKLSEVLDWLPAVENWIASVRQFAYGEAEHGRTPPGYKLVAKRAQRRWQAGMTSTELAEITGFIEEKFLDAPTLKSPAQVEKILGKDKDRIQDLILSESSGLTLVPDGDRRQEVSKKHGFTAITDVTDLLKGKA